MNGKCVICCDNLLRNGFNLGGQPTCPACRVFFHRNASKFEELECENLDSCEINSPESRNNCAKCRLRRCFEIGMQCRTKKIETFESSQSESSSSADSEEFSKSTKYTNYPLDQRLRTLLNECYDLVHLSPDTNEAVTNVKETKQRPVLHELTTYERSQIDLINQFSADSFEEESTLDPLSLIPIESTQFISHISTVYARRFVQFCKKLDFFREVAQNVQLGLLKSFSLRTIVLRVAFNYDSRTRLSKMLANEAGTHTVLVGHFLNVLGAHNSNSREAMKFHRKMLRVNRNLGQDPTIRNLLSVCLLTRPSEEEETLCEFPPLIRLKFYHYSYLLLRYLESKHRKKRLARQIYQDLIRQFVNHHERPTHERMRQHLTHIGVHNLCEFAAEIMNLKIS